MQELLLGGDHHICLQPWTSTACWSTVLHISATRNNFPVSCMICVLLYRVLVFPDWLSPNMFCRLSYRAWDANDSGCPRWPQTNAMLEITVTLPRRHFLERSMPQGQLKESANKTSPLPHCNDIQGGPFLMPQKKFWKQFKCPGKIFGQKHTLKLI